MRTINAYDTIKNRTSVRSYSDKPIDKTVLKELNSFFKTRTSGPFGTAVRFSLLDLGELNRVELRKMGTYGLINGARFYILGAAEEKKGAREDLGYCLETIILKATSLGLGTCWLGGTFKRAAFASKINLAPGEMLPAITPIGYPSKKTSTQDRLVRYSAGSGKRMPWGELFFHDNGNTALSEEDAGDFKDPLEAVRMGPSASNRQPWRIIKTANGSFRFYLKENKLYNRLLGKYRLQYVDMGIAMSHFELVAREQGAPGDWLLNDTGAGYPGLEHIATWSLNT